MSGPVHPPIVRWLLLPLILTAAGALAAGAWEAAAVDPRSAPGELTAFGAGLGLGASLCLAATRRRSLRLLLSPVAALLAQMGMFALWEALRTGAAPELRSWLLQWIEPGVLPLAALPAPVLVFCHSACEDRNASRPALLAYPLLLFPTALVAVIPYGVWPHFPYSGCVAAVAVGQALGMAAVLRLSRKLSPAAAPAGPGREGPRT